MKYFWAFVLFLNLIFIACRTQNSSSSQQKGENQPENTLAVETIIVTPIPVLPVSTAAVLNTPKSSLPIATAVVEDISPSQPLNIAIGDVHQEIWWSPDSKTLYYGIYQQRLAYNLADGTIFEVSWEIGLTQTPEIDYLPLLWSFPLFSPSGNQAVYIQLTPNSLPTLTPNPQIEGGESLDIRRELEIWLWENGNSRLLGQIEQCSLALDFWSPNEDKLVLLEGAIPMPTCFDTDSLTQAWLFDLVQSTITPLFSRGEYPAVQVYGFSPDGQQLLHGFYTDASGANLHLLDIEQFTSAPINGPVSDVVQWLNDQELLVKYRRSPQGFINTIGVLNIHTSEFTELTTMFPESYISYISLSPDNRWLAFTTGPGHFDQTDLWLMEVNLR